MITIREAIGEVLGKAGLSVSLIGGLAGFLIDLKFLLDAYGGSGLVWGFFLGPATFIIVPFLAGFGYGYWLPMIVTLGTAAIVYVLLFISGLLTGESIHKDEWGD